MTSGITVSVRSELIEYGSLPTAPWKSQTDSLPSLHALIGDLLGAAARDATQAGFVSLEQLGAILELNAPQTRGLAILLSGLVETSQELRFEPDGVEIAAIKGTSICLYMVVAYYLRTASRADTADVWPAELFGSQIEPSSPMRLTARAWGRDPQPQHRAHLPSVRQHMAEHMAIHEALLRGFREFVCGNLPLLLAAVGAGAEDGPSAMEGTGEAPQAESLVTAEQLDALGFVLRPGPSPSASPALGWPERGEFGGEGAMDVGADGEAGGAAASLSASSPFAFSASASGPAPSRSAVVGWLADRLGADELGPALSSGDVTMASSPRRHASAFNQLVSLAAPSDLQGLHKATVVRGESDFSGAVARVLDCHDCIIYALAPLRHAVIACCTDCLVVVGAVGAMLRVERCERVQVVAAAGAATVNTCHDCILNLGVTRDPLLAPYNAGYERLEAHAAAVGLRAGVSAWDRPLVLGTAKQQLALGGGGGSMSPAAGNGAPSASADAPPADQANGTLGPVNVSLLPPRKLAPFVVPFRGGPGPLAGGPPSLLSRPARPAGGACFPVSLWPVPQEYREAWEGKMAAANDVRAAVKKAELEDARRRELMAAIQASFKDWLQATGSMRHVYDIARMERAEASPGGTGQDLAGVTEGALDGHQSAKIPGQGPDLGSVLHLKLNDTNTHLALKRSNSGHLQLLLPDERPDEDLTMTDKELQELKLLEEVGLGLEFSPGDPFIGQLVLELLEARDLRHALPGVYATVSDDDSVLTISLKGRSHLGGKQVLGRALLPVAQLDQGVHELELKLEGSKPERAYGTVRVRASYRWLRGTRDDGTYTKVNRMLLHRAGRIARQGGSALAALEHMSQVNHSLLSHDNIWAVLGRRGDKSKGDKASDEGMAVISEEGGPASADTINFPSTDATTKSSPPPPLPSFGRRVPRAHTRSGSTDSVEFEPMSESARALARAAPRVPSASPAAHLQSALAFSTDDAPTLTSALVAEQIEEFLGEADESAEVARLRRSLAGILVPMLERMDVLERRTQTLTQELLKRLNSDRPALTTNKAGSALEKSSLGRSSAASSIEGASPHQTTTTTAASTEVIASAANPVEPFLSGQFEYGVGRPAKKRTVLLFLRKGHWAGHRVYPPGFLGTHRTDAGGRLGPLPLPPTVAAAPGHWEFVGLLPDDYSSAKGSLFMLQPGTKAVVFDLDGTITVGDSQVVTQFTLDALGASTALNSKLSHKYDLRPRRHALHVVRAWAAKGYQPVYLSGRQGSYYNLTLAWLIKHRYPPGPIHLTRTHLPTLPVYFSVGMFKVKYIEQLRAKGVEVYAAYGNTPTDVKAYAAAGVAKERTFIIGPHAGKGGTVKVPNWTDHLPEVLALPDADIPIPYTELLFTARPGYVKRQKVLDKNQKVREVTTVTSIAQGSRAHEEALRASEQFGPSLVPGGGIDDEEALEDEEDELEGFADDSDDETVASYETRGATRLDLARP
ncbi:hypothetical protein QBZ16_001160 [Prototheca wickerhamii]|uniref:C-CAP/cofactor C-like domain-containing protein n=1 Tax=Prototheca wickerhamii TaxID=3111 RepID=A0AAD9IEX9_PROWI|nr:hypothetical protein QBZ16_001160 [Prototheca wickerhamii]